MADLKAIYTNVASQRAAVYKPQTLNKAQTAQLDKLEEILTTISSDDCAFSIELNGLDMAIGISTDDCGVLIPFTLRDDLNGDCRILVDRTGAAPVAFDMFTDEVSFVRFLAVEQYARIQRQNCTMGIADHLANKPTP